MRKLLLLALLLYNIATATRQNYDYEDTKRLSFLDDRRNWRQKNIMKPSEMDQKALDWEDRRRHDYDMNRYTDDIIKGFGGDRPRDPDKLSLSPLRDNINDMDHMTYLDKEPEKKMIPLNCDRPHERYEACFAGCASVSCDNPRDRLRPCYPFCEQGCVCVAPYVRDDRTHKCVLPDECTRGLKGIPDLGDET